MKAIETITIHGRQLSVLIEELEKGKAFVSYFIEGVQVDDWGKLNTLYQSLFTILADELCKGLNLTKWSY